MEEDALCDSCGAQLDGLPSRCALALAARRITLSFNLCSRCQIGLLVAMREFLVSAPPQLVR